MRTLKRRILLAQEEVGISDQFGDPLFVEVVDQSVPDPDSQNLTPTNQVQPVTGYRAGGLFPIIPASAEDPLRVERRPGETLEQLQRRCAKKFPRVALWWPLPEFPEPAGA